MRSLLHQFMCNPPSHYPLNHEKNRRKENQIGNERRKGRFLTMGQQETTEPSPEHTDRNKGSKPRPQFTHTGAETVKTSGGSEHKGEGARCVCDHRIHSEEDQYGKRDQRPSPSHRIDHSGGTGGYQQGNYLNPRHPKKLSRTSRRWRFAMRSGFFF